jgi:hypothetical protein
MMFDVNRSEVLGTPNQEMILVGRKPSSPFFAVVFPTRSL